MLTASRNGCRRSLSAGVSWTRGYLEVVEVFGVEVVVDALNRTAVRAPHWRYDFLLLVVGAEYEAILPARRLVVEPVVCLRVQLWGA